MGYALLATSSIRDFTLSWRTKLAKIGNQLILISMLVRIKKSKRHLRVYSPGLSIIGHWEGNLNNMQAATPKVYYVVFVTTSFTSFAQAKETAPELIAE